MQLPLEIPLLLYNFNVLFLNFIICLFRRHRRVRRGRRCRGSCKRGRRRCHVCVSNVQQASAGWWRKQWILQWWLPRWLLLNRSDEILSIISSDHAPFLHIGGTARDIFYFSMSYDTDRTIQTRIYRPQDIWITVLVNGAIIFFALKIIVSKIIRIDKICLYY